MITVKIKVPNDFPKTRYFCERLLELINKGSLNKYGERGVEALKEATPKDTGKTSLSWSYGIKHGLTKTVLYWSNSNTNDGYNIAIIIQYGHVTQNGFRVEGRDYINPAMKGLFDDIGKDIWEEVLNS